MAVCKNLNLNSNWELEFPIGNSQFPIGNWEFKFPIGNLNFFQLLAPVLHQTSSWRARAPPKTRPPCFRSSSLFSMSSIFLNRYLSTLVRSLDRQLHSHPSELPLLRQQSRFAFSTSRRCSSTRPRAPPLPQLPLAFSTRLDSLSMRCVAHKRVPNMCISHACYSTRLTTMHRCFNSTVASLACSRSGAARYSDCCSRCQCI